MPPEAAIGEPQQGASPADPPAPPAGAADERLAKLERENQRLTQALAKREEAEHRARAKIEESEREAAAKRGEWEKLYGEEKAKGSTLAQQLEEERQRREAYEQLLGERAETALKGVEDPELRKGWKAATDGLDPVQRLRVLDALMATHGTQRQPAARPGAPGRQRGVLDLRVLAQSSPAGESARRELALKKLHERQGR